MRKDIIEPGKRKEKRTQKLVLWVVGGFTDLKNMNIYQESKRQRFEEKKTQVSSKIVSHISTKQFFFREINQVWGIVRL